MPRSPLPRYSFFLRMLRITLLTGAAYDLVFAAAMLLFPEVPARWLRLPLPGEDFYLWLLAILLTMLASCYLLAAYDPISYQGIVSVAIFGRAAGAAAFAIAAWERPELAALWGLAGADLAFALGHAVFWYPVRP